MRWSLVTLDFPPEHVGGVAAWAEDLALALHRAGHELRVYAQRTRQAAIDDSARPYPVIRMEGRSWASWQGLWAGIWAGPRLERGERVVAATWRLATVLAPICRAVGAELVVAAHGSDLTRLTTAPAALRRLSPRCWLPVSRFLSGELDRLGVAGARLVLPMPVGPRGRPAEGPRSGLVCLSRLTPLKGVDRSWRLCRSLGLELTLIGDGDRSALPAGEGLRWLGRLDREGARAELARAQAALLLPRADRDGSGAEGLGLCLIEAALEGTPVIGCRTGGLAEAVGPGLILEDPEQPDLDVLRAFLARAGAGEEARAWALAHHGPGHCLEVLERAFAEGGP
jgi:glycosyltransferase involved in cell wall biosynthesis